jgi:hypothetical protein
MGKWHLFMIIHTIILVISVISLIMELVACCVSGTIFTGNLEMSFSYNHSSNGQLVTMGILRDFITTFLKMIELSMLSNTRQCLIEIPIKEERFDMLRIIDKCKINRRRQKRLIKLQAGYTAKYKLLQAPLCYSYMFLVFSISLQSSERERDMAFFCRITVTVFKFSLQKSKIYVTRNAMQYVTDEQKNGNQSKTIHLSLSSLIICIIEPFTRKIKFEYKSRKDQTNHSDKTTI